MNPADVVSWHRLLRRTLVHSEHYWSRSMCSLCRTTNHKL